jgi:two-component system cell cycle sensor histidine kinase/response regulator CckA
VASHRPPPPGSRAPTRGRSYFVAVLALTGVLVSTLTFWTLRTRERDLLAVDFQLQAHNGISAIQRDLDTALVVVESLAAFLSVIPDVDRDEFRAFANPLVSTYQSIHALEFTPRVTAAERSDFETSVRSGGYPEFSISELAPNGAILPAASRDEYVVVRFIEPLVGNARALGYDIASEPTRREALDRARAGAEAAATGPITLVQETGNQTGFLVASPVYDQALPEGDRRRADSLPRGFAVGVFRVGELVEIALDRQDGPDISIELTDETDPERLAMVYRHGTETLLDDFEVSYSVTQEMELGGRRWVARSWPTETYLAGQGTATPLVALVIGLSLTGLLVAYLLRLDALNSRLAHSETRFSEFAEHMREVFWSADLREPYERYVSPAFEEVWGRSLASFHDSFRSFVDAVHPDDVDRVRAALETLQDGHSTAEEYRIVRPDGSTRWVWDRAYPVLDTDGSVRRIVGVAEDITERKQTEAERLRLERSIQQTQKVQGLGALAGGIAHDFNNLLATILGHAGLALSKLSPDAPARKHVAKIETTGFRAAELVAQMLAYSGRTQFALKRLDLSAIPEDMATLLNTTVSHRAVMPYELEAGLPVMRGDPNQLQQLLLNLVTNAAEAVEDPSGEIRIRTGVTQASRDDLAATYVDDGLPEGRYLYVEVEDAGRGMDRDTLQQMFDPFFTTKFTGRGLGLAAAIGIVRGHDGAIKIDSVPGEGTTIRVLFPVDATEVHPAVPAVVTPPHAGTVLIIDDEDDVRDVTVSILESWGLTVLAARDGRAGIALLRRHAGEVSAILLDLTMPLMDGVETARRLREIDANIPILLCSGYSEQQLGERHADRGFSGFLQKPFRSEELAVKLGAVLTPTPVEDLAE